MATIVTRETGATAKGSPLTNAQLDQNFINLNTELGQKANTTDVNTALAGKVNTSAISNVENKSSATIRGELTSDNVRGALGFSGAILTYNAIINRTDWCRIIEHRSAAGVAGGAFLLTLKGARANSVWNATIYVNFSHWFKCTINYNGGTQHTPISFRAVVDGNGGGYIEMKDHGYNDGGTTQPLDVTAWPLDRHTVLTSITSVQSGATLPSNYNVADTINNQSGGFSFRDYLKITGEGFVTQPKLPAFHAVRVTPAGDTTKASPLVFNSVLENNSNSYNSTTGIFTAPVSGRYHFCAGAHLDAVAGDNTIRLVAAGTQLSNAWSAIGAVGANDRQSQTQMVSGTKYMNAGDTAFVTFYTTRPSNYMAETYWYFTGYLIG